MSEASAREKLIYEALRFSVWAAGEGLCPGEGEPAESPEEFIFAYSQAIGFEDWDGLAASISEQDSAMLAACKAAKGYLLNAKVDLETGTKRTGIRSTERGLKIIEAAIAKAEGDKG